MERNVMVTVFRKSNRFEDDRNSKGERKLPASAAGGSMDKAGGMESLMAENRPHLCLDQECKILSVNYSKEHFDKGWSYFCFGKLKEPHRFTEKECEHVNQYCYCAYTPMKGVLRFFINEDDAWIYQLGMCGIQNDAHPLVCDECGPVNRIGSTVIHFGDGSKLCPMCALRLGKKTWHPEEKKYY